MKEYKIGDNKKAKLRAEGNCTPVFVMLENIAYYAKFKRHEDKDCDLTWFKTTYDICHSAINEYLEELPVFYKDNARRRAKKIGENIYYNYFARNKFETGKVFMTMRAWIYDLAANDLIDFYNEDYIKFLEELTDTIDRGLDGEYEKEQLDYVTSKSVEKRYKSAEKHVKHLYNIAYEKDLYINFEVIAA